eukprot:m.160490 g.160490  ORF g.160490 m.160490 type:complete len:190 (+) comp11954_c0_seq1:3008-3577(+)
MAADAPPKAGAAPDEVGKMYNGIPAAFFVEDVAKLMSDRKLNAKALLEECDNMYQQYKMMESRLGQRQRKLQSQVIEIKSSLGMLEHLSGIGPGETLDTDFRLNDALFVKATITQADKVGLWLGANVMLEYDTKEALELLKKNFETAKSNIVEIKSSMDYLRDQITTVEVNMARIYNHDVTLRRQGQQA